ncbi:MAG: TIGR03118 family protein [Isosphaeraceae bacterium]
MWFSSWLRNGKRSAPAARRRTQTSPRRRASFGPRLEAIEDRCLMSTAIVRTNLVSDDTQFTPAQVQDANLVNPWGLAASPTGEWWVANEGTGTSTLYKTSTSPLTTFSLVVGVPPSSTSSPHGAPTGIVYNPGGGFDVSEKGRTGSSDFLFATADGTISGWSPSVDPTHAVVAATNPGAIYLGLAIATDSHHDTWLYAADFANGTIDVYDQSFHLVTTLPGKFTDSQLPSDYHPFNIQAIGNRLYVEYAPADDVLAGTAAPGEGAVDVYNADGQLLERLIRPDDTHINQPWAVVMAPSNFGAFSNDLLVGNFGDGTINAFDPRNGDFVGELKNAKGQPIVITHLWGLAFGNGGAAGPKNTLYFTAGLTSHLAPSDNPFHGVFGSLQIERTRPGGR